MNPMNKTPPVEPARWLTLIANLPTEDPAARMRVLRTLESLGAAVIREGVYLVPETPATRQGLDHLAEYVSKGAGNAQVLSVEQRGTRARVQVELAESLERRAFDLGRIRWRRLS